MFEIIRIDNKNNNFISDFLNNAGAALKKFRYYEKRSIDVISNHLVTCVLMQNGEAPVGYGHLDKDGNDIWLGIAVNENHIGKGFGKLIISYLLDFAIKEKINLIKLTVDVNNQKAISLYEKVGFIIETMYSEKVYLMKKIINA